VDTHACSYERPSRADHIMQCRRRSPNLAKARGTALERRMDYDGRI
jgi:hypothetical protein